MCKYHEFVLNFNFHEMRDYRKDQQIYIALKHTLVKCFNFEEKNLQSPSQLVKVYEESKRLVSKQKGVMEQTSANLKHFFDVDMSAKYLSHYYAKTFSKHGKLQNISQSGKIAELRTLVREGYQYRRKCEVVADAMDLLGSQYAKSVVEGFVYREWKNCGSEEVAIKCSPESQELFRPSVVIADKRMSAASDFTPASSAIRSQPTTEQLIDGLMQVLEGGSD